MRTEVELRKIQKDSPEYGQLVPSHGGGKKEASLPSLQSPKTAGY